MSTSARPEGERLLRVTKPAGAPLRVAVMCSDGPQHAFLLAGLAHNFGVVGAVVEESRGQRQRLFRRRRYVDWWYRLLHEWRQRILGHRRYRRRYFAARTTQDPVPREVVRVAWVNSVEVVDALQRWRPEVTVVCGTSFIRPEVLAHAGLAINVHAGCLPDYRGNQCIFTALYEGNYDQVAATLHLATADLDGGPILAIIKPPMYPTDGEEQLYCRSMHTAMRTLFDFLADLDRGGELIAVPQPSGGRMIRNRDRHLGQDLRWLTRRWIRRRRLPTRSHQSVQRPSAA
jgi:hypothetical protein